MCNYHLGKEIDINNTPESLAYSPATLIPSISHRKSLTLIKYSSLYFLYSFTPQHTFLSTVVLFFKYDSIMEINSHILQLAHLKYTIQWYHLIDRCS